MKKTYEVEITETLKKTLVVKANSKEEALEKVKARYNDASIVLYPDDFIDVNFTSKQVEKEKEIMR